MDVQKQHLTWEEIERLVDRLVAQLKEPYDGLLAITRGGLVPACLVSERIDQRNILVAAMMFYTGVGQTLAKPVFLQFPPDPYLNGRRILVVDDVWDSGRTAMAVRTRIEEAGGFPEVAVLHYKPKASRFPDQRPQFYAQETDAWIVYPWDPAKER